jgi:hypothetical protein
VAPPKVTSDRRPLARVWLLVAGVWGLALVLLILLLAR